MADLSPECAPKRTFAVTSNLWVRALNRHRYSKGKHTMQAVIACARKLTIQAAAKLQ
jgi:hypothetical protein